MCLRGFWGPRQKPPSVDADVKFGTGRVRRRAFHNEWPWSVLVAIETNISLSHTEPSQTKAQMRQK